MSSSALKVGIVGLPNAGKSTLFNALVTKPKASVGKYPFTTIEKNIGVVNVPDSKLFELAKIEGIADVVPATITFVDIAGLIAGAHEGEGLGNQFLHHIREVDLIVHVVRFFKTEDVPHVHQKIDPQDDVVIVNDELIFADLETLERRLTKEKVSAEEKEVLKHIFDELDRGSLAKDIPLSDKELVFIKPLNLLTLKKQLFVANIGEEDLKNPPSKINGQEAVPISARLESELCELPWTQQRQFLKEYGLSESAKEAIILSCYKALDIITFYTIAKRTKAQAWTIKKSSKAVDAAGKIHTDFAKKFIRAEVINIDQLLSFSGWHKAKQAGKIRLEGKDYIIQDEDVVEFLIGS